MIKITILVGGKEAKITKRTWYEEFQVLEIWFANLNSCLMC